MSVRVYTDHFHSVTGFELFRRHWLPELMLANELDSAPSTHCSLAIVHGLGEHSARYDRFATSLASQGIAVHAFDQQGHGESAGPRLDAERFEDLIDDVKKFVCGVAQSEPPVFVLGHSLGALLVATWLTSELDERMSPVRGAILSAPPLAWPAGTPRLGPTLRRCLARVAGRFRFSTGIDPVLLSRDPSVVAGYRSDPRVGRRLTLRFGLGILETILQTARRASRMKVPTLILHGTADRIASGEASERFFAELGTAGSAIHLYPGLYHEVLNEPEHAQVEKDIILWIESQLRRGEPVS